jgi:hypothetical protein
LVTTVVLSRREDTAETAGWFSFRAFGHTIACNRPLPGWLPRAAGSPELTLSFTSVPPLEWDMVQPDLAYMSQAKSQDGRSILSLYRTETCPVMRFLDMADFHIWPDRVICCLHQDVPDHTMNSLLFANVLPFWLELKGFITIHASAITMADKAVAFIAHSRNGKSTLAATMLQEGCSLLTDDVLPVIRQGADFWAYPGYPAMRMWPGEAEHFLTTYEELERVHPEFTKRYVPMNAVDLGEFCDRPCPLERIYILERREVSALQDGLEIKSLTHRDALIELLRYTFVTHLAEAAGLAPNRFDFLAGLVRKVTVRRLIYQSGYEYLPQVRQAILIDR